MSHGLLIRAPVLNNPNHSPADNGKEFKVLHHQNPICILQNTHPSLDPVVARDRVPSPLKGFPPYPQHTSRDPPSLRCQMFIPLAWWRCPFSSQSEKHPVIEPVHINPWKSCQEIAAFSFLKISVFRYLVSDFWDLPPEELSCNSSFLQCLQLGWQQDSPDPLKAVWVCSLCLFSVRICKNWH